jgi:squalene-hopene/tetraprenyl-beta-curcumene cyclase
MITPARLEAAYQTAIAALLAERTPEGHWVGELSTSALSTATAVMALHLVGARGGARHDELVAGGLRWLAADQNADGGWGDTVKSLSNISTTMLCRAAFYLTDTQAPHADTVGRAESWLAEHYGKTPAELAEAVRARYGKDRTFATPILTTCALAGLVPWSEVPPLPFELACLPQSWFRFVRLHVVSYALPALIAIGQAVYHHRPPKNPITRLVRALSRKRSLRVLKRIQPSSGGYLEATPLTSFVTLSLAACDLANHPVAASAVRFLASGVRPDGSWAIDSNLATWVTTLSINALATAGELQSLDRQAAVRDWLLKQQHNEWHPYTGAAPGGWAWTDLPGGVPDADDTPGAVLALSRFDVPDAAFETRLKIGVEVSRQDFEAAARIRDTENRLWYGETAFAWLELLQNRDGGWPTFCRGWGHLPFDRSGSDLTAHAIRAFVAHERWLSRQLSEYSIRWNETPEALSAAIYRGWGRMPVEHGLAYLARSQRPDGSWLPLWFGNQHVPDDENPTYGTARVLAAYRDLSLMNDKSAQRGAAWLLANQNPDGGWGGGLGTPSSLEETALAVEVLLDAAPGDAVERGLAWIVARVEQGGLYEPTPIGFYFAKLWYFEKLYPIIFTVAALGRARRKLREASQ